MNHFVDTIELDIYFTHLETSFPALSSNCSSSDTGTRAAVGLRETDWKLKWVDGVKFLERKVQ